MYEYCNAPMVSKTQLNNFHTTDHTNDPRRPRYPLVIPTFLIRTIFTFLVGIILIPDCNLCIHSLEQPASFPPMVSVCMHLQTTEMRNTAMHLQRCATLQCISKALICATLQCISKLQICTTMQCILKALRGATLQCISKAPRGATLQCMCIVQ